MKLQERMKAGVRTVAGAACRAATGAVEPGALEAGGLDAGAVKAGVVCTPRDVAKISTARRCKDFLCKGFIIDSELL
jgi:hypothetical protein